MATSAYRGIPNNKKKTSFHSPPKPQMTGKRTSFKSASKGRFGGPRDSLKEIRKKPDVKETSKKTPMKKSKYAHNLKMVGMPQDGGYMNQDYVIKGISTNLSQGNPNNKTGEYKDKNKGVNDRIVKPKKNIVKPKKNKGNKGIGPQVPDLSTYDPADKSTVDYSKDNKDGALNITIDTGPLNQNPGALMGNKHTGPRRKKVGKGSYQRGTKAPKTKLVLAPHRNPTNKKVRVIDRPGKPRPKNTSGSARFSGGGLVASLYESF